MTALCNVFKTKTRFSPQVSSRGRTIQPSSKVDKSCFKKRDAASDSTKHGRSDLVDGSAPSIREEVMDTVTISDAEGNVLAQIQVLQLLSLKS